eukprot:COSAG02_NODE_36_length_48934_cov_144.851029_13_plen_53_part_00
MVAYMRAEWLLGTERTFSSQLECVGKQLSVCSGEVCTPVTRCPQSRAKAATA